MVSRFCCLSVVASYDVKRCVAKSTNRFFIFCIWKSIFNLLLLLSLGWLLLGLLLANFIRSSSRKKNRRIVADAVRVMSRQTRPKKSKVTEK